MRLSMLLIELYLFCITMVSVIFCCVTKKRFDIKCHGSSFIQAPLLNDNDSDNDGVNEPA